MRGLNCSEACGILVPWPGIKLASFALQGRFLTTGPPGKSRDFHLLLINLFIETRWHKWIHNRAKKKKRNFILHQFWELLCSKYPYFCLEQGSQPGDSGPNLASRSGSVSPPFPSMLSWPLHKFAYLSGPWRHLHMWPWIRACCLSASSCFTILASELPWETEQMCSHFDDQDTEAQKAKGICLDHTVGSSGAESPTQVSSHPDGACTWSGHLHVSKALRLQWALKTCPLPHFFS